MRKRSRKLVSILLTLSMLAVLLLPMAAPAAAAGSYSAVTAPTVEDDTDNVALGKIKVTFDVSDITTADSLFFRLPSDFEINNVQLSPAKALAAGDVTWTQVSDNEIKVTYYGTATNAATYDEAIFYVDFTDVNVPEYEGDIVCTIDAPTNSAFSDGSVVIGKTSGGEVTVEVIDTDTSNNDFTVKLRIKENVSGAISDEADSLKFILPDGYEWTGIQALSYNHIWGTDINNNDAYNNWTVEGDEISYDPDRKSSVATCFEVVLEFEVVDEDEVEAGDITAKVKGESTVSPSSIVVGTYGDYSATAEAVDADDLPTVYAGKIEQEVSNILIKEAIKETLINGRYIKLELPSYARWTHVDDRAEDSSVQIDFDGVAGSEGNVIKYTISNGPSTGAAELELEDLKVMLDVCAPGDLKVKVSGNAGVEGEFAIAKIASSVTAKAESKPEVKIGMAAQKIGDITITEAEAGAISGGSGKYLVLKVPQGVEIAKLPKVEVVSGDLDIDTAGIYRSKPASTDFYQLLNIPIEDDSNEASTIKVSDLYVTVDRTVAEGDLKVAVLGSAVLESNGKPLDNTDWFAGGLVGAAGAEKADIDNDGVGDYDASASLFPATAAYTAAAAAVVATPAPGETKANASFVIGSTTYKLNGADKTMDVAPYIKDGRTYLPVRYVAYALGVSESNILWDQATQKVTLIKGDKVVQLTIGSKVLLVNGATITMDVAPEITSDRTMLPIRHVAQVLGANVGWDEATQTVTIN